MATREATHRCFLINIPFYKYISIAFASLTRLLPLAGHGYGWRWRARASTSHVLPWVRQFTCGRCAFSHMQIIEASQTRWLCSWYGGVITLIVSWMTSLYTLHQLVALHEYEGKRFNRRAPCFSPHPTSTCDSTLRSDWLVYTAFE